MQFEIVAEGRPEGKMQLRGIDLGERDLRKAIRRRWSADPSGYGASTPAMQ